MTKDSNEFKALINALRERGLLRTVEETERQLEELAELVKQSANKTASKKEK